MNENALNSVGSMSVFHSSASMILCYQSDMQSSCHFAETNEMYWSQMELMAAKCSHVALSRKVLGKKLVKMKHLSNPGSQMWNVGQLMDNYMNHGFV